MLRSTFPASLAARAQVRELGSANQIYFPQTLDPQLRKARGSVHIGSIPVTDVVKAVATVGQDTNVSNSTVLETASSSAS